MRTDSTRVCDGRPRRRARAASAPPTASEYLPEKPIVYKSKKDAQDAHEAIRPTYLDRDPESIKRYLSKDEYALYRLIWNRFVASQMRPAVYDETVVDIEAGPYLLRAKGSTLKFKGFLAVYEETPDEQRTRPARGRKIRRPRTTPRPRRRKGSCLRWRRATALTLRKLDTDQHFTQPPPRFSEATPRQGARGERHRPALHLRLDHRDHRGPRVHGEARGQALSRPSSASSSPTCWSSTSRTS